MAVPKNRHNRNKNKYKKTKILFKTKLLSFGYTVCKIKSIKCNNISIQSKMCKNCLYLVNNIKSNVGK